MMTMKSKPCFGKSWLPLLAGFSAAGLSCGPASASRAGEVEKAAAQPCQVAPAAKPQKRKGLGLGGLLGAVQQAGVGRILGGVGGSGDKGQIASAVVGTALEAAANSSAKKASAEAAEAANSAVQAAAGCPAAPGEPTAGN
jgi:hypothetical protein